MFVSHSFPRILWYWFKSFRTEQEVVLSHLHVHRVIQRGSSIKKEPILNSYNEFGMSHTASFCCYWTNQSLVVSSFSTVNKIFFNGGLKYRHLNQTLIVCFFCELIFYSWQISWGPYNFARTFKKGHLSIFWTVSPGNSNVKMKSYRPLHSKSYA